MGYSTVYILIVLVLLYYIFNDNESFVYDLPKEKKEQLVSNIIKDGFYKNGPSYSKMKYKYPWLDPIIHENLLTIYKKKEGLVTCKSPLVLFTDNTLRNNIKEVLKMNTL